MQVDVKFLQLKDREGKVVKRYQYTAIDDATRNGTLQTFAEHNQDRAIQFLEYVVERFPFRISTVRTDRGHEFQARFHWHVYIKPQTPQLNGKVERSHRTDQTEFYQLLTDMDFTAKQKVWETFYNYDRHHISLDGTCVLRRLLPDTRCMKFHHGDPLPPEIVLLDRPSAK